MHGINIRQEKILKLLKTHKHLTTSQIADHVEKSIRTIRIDLAFLKEQFPQIDIVKGRYGGGVYWRDENEK